MCYNFDIIDFHGHCVGIQIKALETVLAGALRREQAAENLFKRSAVEIDHLKRLVGTVPIYSAPWFQITVLVAMIVMANFNHRLLCLPGTSLWEQTGLQCSTSVLCFF
jgi:hypothetical protein